jgi:aspartyl-tRNA(Asn)/glutamyl-tRNA(Gln) amidotransferase subunit C
MTLTIEEVKHIAHLARLRLSPEEMNLYRDQLSEILDYAARLQEIDTSGIPPTSSVLPARAVLRADTPQQGLSIEDLFANAPEADQDQFKVPPVLE